MQLSTTRLTLLYDGHGKSGRKIARDIDFTPEKNIRKKLENVVYKN